MEQSRKGSLGFVGEDPLNQRQGTVFDKPAPSGPPTPPLRDIPPHLKKLIRFFEGIIADESLLLDLCMDRCVGIVEFNYKKRSAGSDLMESVTPAHFVMVAAPLAVELYKQVLSAIEGQAKEYTEILAECKKELASGNKAPPVILTP
jgi:hypothetical protein